MRAFAQRLGYAVYQEYNDQESGGSAERPQFQLLFLDAHQRHFEAVLFWRLDRLSRKGVTEMLNHLQRLTITGVQFKYFTEQYLDSTGLFREAIIGFLAAIAKQERVRFSGRIKAGQARSSKAPGRPALAEEVAAKLRRLQVQGLGFKKIQLATGVLVATMHKCLTIKSCYMKKSALFLFAVALLVSCSYRKQRFKSAFRFQKKENLYGEFYSAGILGNMSSLYLTDSATFRQCLGTYDDENELIYARFHGDSVVVSQRRTDSRNQKESPITTTYSLKALRTQGNFD